MDVSPWNMPSDDIGVEHYAHTKKNSTRPAVPVELPVADYHGLDAATRPRAERTIDQRDWQNGLHGGERLVLRRSLALSSDAEGEP